MSKGLEKLQENNVLYHKYTIHQVYGETLKADNVEKQINENNSIIEKELKDYYALKKECEEAKWYQEHKVLGIIKETFKVTFNDEEQTIGIDNVYFLTFKDKTKYDLLKEVEQQ